MSTPTHRRHFCRTASQITLAVAASCRAGWPRPLVAQEDAHAIGQHIFKSLKWNMVQLEGTLTEKFRVLKEIGFDGVELDCPSDIDADEALAASQSAELPIEGIVNSTHWNIRHSDPDLAVRQQAAENMSQAMRFAKHVGADSVLLVPGKVTDAQHENHDQVWHRSIAEIRGLLSLAERLKVFILIENVGNGFCESPELLAKYIDEIASPWVQVHFDIGNHIRVSPPAEWIRVLGKRIKKLDVKDRMRTNEKTLIGDGQADWAAVRVALDEIGYRGWAAAEVSGGDRQQLSDVLARMNRVLGKSVSRDA